MYHIAITYETNEKFTYHIAITYETKEMLRIT